MCVSVLGTQISYTEMAELIKIRGFWGTRNLVLDGAGLQSLPGRGTVDRGPVLAYVNCRDYTKMGMWW